MCLAAMVHPCDVCFVSSKQVGSRPLTRLQLCGSLLRLSFQALLKYKTYIPRELTKGGGCILFFCHSHSHSHSHNDISNVYLLVLSKATG